MLKMFAFLSFSLWPLFVETLTTLIITKNKNENLIPAQLLQKRKQGRIADV